MDWFFQSFFWYLSLFLLGLLFYPFTKKVFSNFVDYGYAFSKTIAILLLSYTVFLFGFLKIMPFERISLFGLIGVLIIILFVYRQKFFDKEKNPWFFIILEEVLFLSSFLIYAYVRAHEPSIRSLEKFMDFGFINSILRSKFFPPIDMWLSADPSNPGGYPINYYYFGHLTSAFLIKLTGVKASIGYNLSLITILSVGITSIFSLCANLVYFFIKTILKQEHVNKMLISVYGLIGALVVNLGGNLHTIYLFTKGYPNESPIPYWQIMSWFNPTKYWYPNATRFIPFTIHEFPSYSYTVADLHGHVLDIPFVILIIAFLFLIITKIKDNLETKKIIRFSIPTGFLIAILYMTNAFDGPIYFLVAFLLLLFFIGWNIRFLIAIGSVIISIIAFSFPFVYKFKAFVTGIGLNCPPNFLSNLKTLGPFIFIKENCQLSPLWMFFVLWGFFLTSFGIFIYIKLQDKKYNKKYFQNDVDGFILVLFLISIALIFIPEFFYVKDIYPAHFRANTMFKLGYQAFIIMGIASTYAIYRFSLQDKKNNYITTIIVLMLFLVLIYPFFSFPSYYPLKNKPANITLDGVLWIKNEKLQDSEIIEYFNRYIKGQPIILEAQGDSYTDYERISANTGLPTIAGWWVHEWLWRGSADVVGKRIPEIGQIYESNNLSLTKKLLKKYKVKYIVISDMERERYKDLKENKFNKNFKKIFVTTNKKGAVYQAN